MSFPRFSYFRKGREENENKPSHLVEYKAMNWIDLGLVSERRNNNTCLVHSNRVPYRHDLCSSLLSPVKILIVLVKAQRPGTGNMYHFSTEAQGDAQVPR